MTGPSFSEYAKTHYFAEFERKKDLTSIITISTGIASLVGAGIYGLTANAPRISSTFGAIFYVFTFLSAVAFLTSAYHLARAFIGHEYKFTASMGRIVASRNLAHQNGFTDSQVEVSTSLLIEEQYIEAVAFNELTNDAKSGLLNRANVALVRSVLALFAAAVLIILSRAMEAEEKSSESRRGSETQQPAGNAARTEAPSGSAARTDH